MPVNVLSHATQMSLRVSGQVEAAKLMKELITSTPTCASKYRKVFKQAEAPKKLSGEDALAVIVDAKLSRYQYKIIWMKTKKQCYPKPEDIQITSTHAEVSLQALLDHTVQRLFLVQKPVIGLLLENELDKFILYSKWGFDGSSGHVSYKQAFCSTESSDSAVFITSIVPLRLVNSDKIIWQNPRPASTRYYTSIAEKEKVQSQISKLINSTVTFDNKSFFVTHNLILAMVDGKIYNAFTDTTSTLRLKTDNLSFGIPVLHGWIHFVECLFHFSYKLPLKKWQVRGDINPNQDLEILMMVTQPDVFFQNSEISAKIIKLDVEIIKKNTYSYDSKYSDKTAKYFVEKYPWYNMSPTMHKFFIHGPEIIASALLPIGQLTEEAQEDRNKDFKRYREHNSRKCCREKTNLDILNLFLLNSDPVISNSDDDDNDENNVDNDDDDNEDNDNDDDNDDDDNEYDQF
ncbi:hypothetical protein QTP88_025613 [Uroleucon formosanum]